MLNDCHKNGQVQWFNKMIFAYLSHYIAQESDNGHIFALPLKYAIDTSVLGYIEIHLFILVWSMFVSE